MTSTDCFQDQEIHVAALSLRTLPNFLDFRTNVGPTVNLILSSKGKIYFFDLAEFEEKTSFHTIHMLQ